MVHFRKDRTRIGWLLKDSQVSERGHDSVFSYLDGSYNLPTPSLHRISCEGTWSKHTVWVDLSICVGPVFESQALTLEVHPLETWAESTVCFNTGMGLACHGNVSLQSIQGFLGRTRWASVGL